MKKKLKKDAHLDKLITTRGDLKKHFDFPKFGYFPEGC
tara:strand:- start:87 stop:200 length:114 start_codon:yes stop_codon:yes gene_type:complete